MQLSDLKYSTTGKKGFKVLTTKNFDTYAEELKWSDVYEKNGKVGFLDDKFKEKIAPNLNHAYPFKDGLALVNKSYYIDTQGKKAEKLVEGAVRSGNCHELPNYMKTVFPGYECISLYPGDICEQIEKGMEKEKENQKKKHLFQAVQNQAPDLHNRLLHHIFFLSV